VHVESEDSSGLATQTNGKRRNGVNRMRSILVIVTKSVGLLGIEVGTATLIE
jgi:hypothetical protein